MKIHTVARFAVGVALAGTLTACSGDSEPDEALPPTAEAPADTPDTKTPSEILASTAWETTGAKDAKGTDVPLTNAAVKDFVGYAYFDDDGTFEMYNLDDTPKLQGDWTVSDDGKTRTIVAKDESGKELFTRDVDIRTLTADEFTYRVYPNEDDKTVYYDIVHTPTDHADPEDADEPGDDDMGSDEPDDMTDRNKDGLMDMETP